MKIVDFTRDHISQALHIAKQNYERARGFVPALPPVESMPELTTFAENSLGVAAFDGDDMVGFLCSVSPFNNAFGSTCATGVFSPMGANGATGENRAAVYARLYQAAGEKWARAGAASHAVCLYAHDKEAREQFFRYGFGMRTVDAIRGMEEINSSPCDGYEFSELAPEELAEVYPLEVLLDRWFIESPVFMNRKPATKEKFLENTARYPSVYFTAKYQGKIIAFIHAEPDGETFIQNTPGYLHCKGLYCLPEHRGKGIPKHLLNLLIENLKNRGYTRLGVDFESINPPAYNFWLKYFHAYTYGVVRRIDEGFNKV